MSRLDVTWLKHAKNKEEREEIKRTLVSNTYTLNLLKEILERELNEKNRSSFDEYSSPNWAYQQADKNGYKRALQSFINLLAIKED
jgi:hypothetical protein